MMSLDLMAVFLVCRSSAFSCCLIDASVGCGWIPKESAVTIWGAGLEDCELIGSADLLVLILFSLRAFDFLKLVFVCG